MDLKVYFHAHSKELLESMLVERQEQQKNHRYLHLEEQRDDCPHTLSEDEIPAHHGIVEEELEFVPANKVNRGASLLTFDPLTGLCKHKILGKAYVVVDSGNYPLSNHQVFGLVELVSSVRDVYHCDPEHSQRGIEKLLRQCQDYRSRNYGPLTIYEPRFLGALAEIDGGADVDPATDPWNEDTENLSTRTVVPAEHYRYRHRRHHHNHARNCVSPAKICGLQRVSREKREMAIEDVDPAHPIELSCSRGGDGTGDKNGYGHRARFRDDDVYHLMEPLEQPFIPPTPLQQQKQQCNNKMKISSRRHHRHHHTDDQPTKRRFPGIFAACSPLA